MPLILAPILAWSLAITSIGIATGNVAYTDHTGMPICMALTMALSITESITGTATAIATDSVTDCHYY